MMPLPIASNPGMTVGFLHDLQFISPVPNTMTFEDDSFQQRIYNIVAAIPFGYVTTYGEIAQLAGSPRAARQVGGVLKRLPAGSKLPWYRVINRKGEISLVGDDLGRQRRALMDEGIQVSLEGKVDLKRYRWQP